MSTQKGQRQGDLWVYEARATGAGVGFLLDPGYMDLPPDIFEEMAPQLSRALAEMAALEGGAIANPDEGRRVGHYWLRDPQLAPEPALGEQIAATNRRIGNFAAEVHSGRQAGTGSPLRNVLLIGIGGSALGPQLVSAALGGEGDRMRPFFIDNTDPDGIDRVLQQIGATEVGLRGTLVLVTSKSGGTKETRNGQLEVAAAFQRAGLRFSDHAVAITSDGSELYKTATTEGWRTTFPMWDWVGGRTSVMSAVGLLPAALQGLDIEGMLVGAREMDGWTRRTDARKNPAAVLALCWHHAVQRGRRDMVILPYKDRLELFSRYLQQLVMESLGKERDLDGNVVNEGIAVYGNKGSTDQHAYVQQLRDGVNNFFATFIEVLEDRRQGPVFVEDHVTSGDYLLGFLLGTRRALHDSGRLSLTITVPDVSARTLGMLIALYERAVGLYASLVRINAYHQPGVEAGKKAAATVLQLQLRLLHALSGTPRTAEELCADAGGDGDTGTAWKVLEHLADNGRIQRALDPGGHPLTARFSK